MPNPPLPKSRQAAFLDSPVYVSFSVDEWNDEELAKYFLGSGTLNAWCQKCEQPSVFRINDKMASYGQPAKTLPHAGTIEISASCTRNPNGEYFGCNSPLVMIFYKDYKTVRKIGQEPSAADLAIGSLDEAFSKELDPKSRRELGRAIGLFAHGVGIGAFVYLRRIFESLLEEAHVKAKVQKEWNEPSYKGARVPERIKLLRDFLPARLVKSATLYGVLSMGIHQLSEEDCLNSFELVRSAIELILKERHEEKRYDAVVGALPQS